jgi:hypothetical protein
MFTSTPIQRIRMPLRSLAQECRLHAAETVSREAVNARGHHHGTLRAAESADRQTANAFAGYMRNIVMLLQQSPTGAALLRAAINHGASVGLDPLLEPDASFFYPRQNHFDLGYQPGIGQKTEKGMSRYMIPFIGSLRRCWHHHRGMAPDVALKPKDFVEHARIMQADIDAVIHLVAWELRGQGQSFLWRALLAGDNADVAQAFEDCVGDNPQNQFNGIALKAAFNRWFACRERVNACEHLALETLDMAVLQHDDLSQLGHLSLSRATLQQLGALPASVNYLTGCSLTSGWYAGMDDAFNRSHLRHIEADIFLSH